MFYKVLSNNGVTLFFKATIIESETRTESLVLKILNTMYVYVLFFYSKLDWTLFTPGFHNFQKEALTRVSYSLTVLLCGGGGGGGSVFMNTSHQKACETE